MNNKHYLTPEGEKALRAELAQLKGSERDAISRRLRDAIQMGDLSENADYHKAKEDQGFLEGRIMELEYILHNAEIIDRENVGRDKVEVGVHVTVQEEDFTPETYFIVGAKEADPRNGKISNESPVGKALLGAKVGDEVSVSTPAGGQLRLKVLNIA
jgi:transcription elongation factor GreA